MGYTLEAVIGTPDVLQPVVARWPVAVIAPLGLGLALVPMTDELFDAATDGTTKDALGFWRLPAGFDRGLSEWSVAGPIAFAEAEYFGGVGSQRAAVWDGGRLAVGPLISEEGDTFSSEEGGPISQVLARLGVRRDGHHDEFDTVDLGRNRDTADWLSEPRS